ncbi:PREDICTED: uncharacterized protein LOC109467132, partial [Branchiostoma belcheri]|uniref:Uncharacterized protein LOC109467132 n=1 Tax=Branchiostoma belcheri TaxID=7741 RepID=A0A6P4YTM4_BRABE
MTDVHRNVGCCTVCKSSLIRICLFSSSTVTVNFLSGEEQTSLHLGKTPIADNKWHSILVRVAGVLHDTNTVELYVDCALDDKVRTNAPVLESLGASYLETVAELRVAQRGPGKGQLKFK